MPAAPANAIDGAGATQQGAPQSPRQVVGNIVAKSTGMSAAVGPKPDDALVSEIANESADTDNDGSLSSVEKARANQIKARVTENYSIMARYYSSSPDQQARMKSEIIRELDKQATQDGSGASGASLFMDMERDFKVYDSFEKARAQEALQQNARGGLFTQAGRKAAFGPGGRFNPSTPMPNNPREFLGRLTPAITAGAEGIEALYDRLATPPQRIRPGRVGL
jgi:hypothetical protein